MPRILPLARQRRFVSQVCKSDLNSLGGDRTRHRMDDADEPVLLLGIEMDPLPQFERNLNQLCAGLW